ncbi:MAG: chemotaxis protein CheX [Candidatus Marinimicrobia bacterium]|nr:chemotaxis protein CheX [Candidatus Neomarinimicrobiota bacterium]
MEVERIVLLENVFCDVFENLAFMFGELVDTSELTNSSTNHVRAKMDFSGARTGQVMLTVPNEMCPEIAANVLGIDPEDDQVQELAGDALKEMLNIICGQLLTELEGHDKVFNLSVPEIQNIDSSEWSSLLNKEGSLGFIVDEYPAILYVRID